jgi:hypothetical protein
MTMEEESQEGVDYMKGEAGSLPNELKTLM